VFDRCDYVGVHAGVMIQWQLCKSNGTNVIAEVSWHQCGCFVRMYKHGYVGVIVWQCSSDYV
jgi:hypothetical protein